MFKVFYITWIVCHLCRSQGIAVDYDDDADFHHLSGRMKKSGGFSSFRTSKQEDQQQQQQQSSQNNNNIDNNKVPSGDEGLRRLINRWCKFSVFHFCRLLPNEKHFKTLNDLEMSSEGFDESGEKKESSAAEGERPSTEVDDVIDFPERPGTTILKQMKQAVEKPQKVTKSSIKRNKDGWRHGWKEGWMEGRGKRRWSDVLRVCINSMCSTYDGQKRFNCILRYCQR